MLILMPRSFCDHGRADHVGMRLAFSLMPATTAAVSASKVHVHRARQDVNGLDRFIRHLADEIAERCPDR
jgi:hypothetical protein